MAQIHFNSIKVQLELLKIIIKVLIYAYFNSIKVQLEQVSTKEFSLNPIFQFHKGTIRTDLSHRHMFTAQVFQFHKGTIRTSQKLMLVLLFLYFNSIKVQLEQTLSCC